MNVNNNVGNQPRFSGLVVKPSVSRASYRGRNLLEREALRIIDESKDVDVTVSGKFFQDFTCDVKTDFVVKVSKKLPQAKNIIEMIKNAIFKPFRPSKKALAGWNYGFFDDPLTVVKNAKKELLDSLQTEAAK